MFIIITCFQELYAHLKVKRKRKHLLLNHYYLQDRAGGVGNVSLLRA